MRIRLLTLVLCVAAIVPLASCTMPTHEQQVAANEKYLAKEGITALKPGDPAPALDGLVDAQGQPAGLPALVEQHPTGLLLFFIPAVDTPNSQRNLLDWDKRSAALAEQGLGLACIAPGGPAAVSAWGAGAGVKLPLYADPSGGVARAWGCLSASGSFPQRTTVGVAPDGKVVLFYRGQADAKSIESAFGIAAKK